jgi:glycosyltransferase involved in cell wall biosynthesis
MLDWLYESVGRRDADLLHNHGLWMMPNVYPGWVAKRYKIPLVVSPRGTLSQSALCSGSVIKKIFWPFIQRPSLSGVTCFHATASSELDDIRRMGFRQPVAVIPNGIDIPQAKGQRKRGVRTLLFLGRIHPIKGVDRLLHAWSALETRHRDWRLRIVGPDSQGYLAKMRAIARELDLQRVEFTGPLRGEAKLNAYREAELFVLPTLSENFGVAVAESLACGTPAVVSKGSPWANLNAKEAGWWIDTGTAALEACLDNAISKSPEVLEAMGRRGRDWMERDYSWSSISSKMIASYRWLLKGGVRPEWIVED